MLFGRSIIKGIHNNGTTKGAWCKWLITEEYIERAFKTLEEYKIDFKYVRLVNLPLRDPLCRTHLLLIYRNPPYKEAAKRKTTKKK